MTAQREKNPHTEREQSVAGPDTQGLCVHEEDSACLLRVFNAPNPATQAPPLVFMFSALLCGRWRGRLTSFQKERGIIACRPTSGSSEMSVASPSYSVCVGCMPLSWNGSPK